jgi:hypothetical protein
LGRRRTVSWLSRFCGGGDKIRASLLANAAMAATIIQRQNPTVVRGECAAAYRQTVGAALVGTKEAVSARSTTRERVNNSRRSAKVERRNWYR